MNRISVFGLGKVGLPLAVCLADAGHEVAGVDPSAELVEQLNRGEAPTEEPGVSERLERVIGRTFRPTLDGDDGILSSDVTFVIVPTPSNSLGGFSLRWVRRACEQIGAALRRKNSYHVVAVVSTMLPSASQYVVLPCLEESSGRRVGEDFGYCYNPAFIALGEVVRGFVEPDFVLIGQSDAHAGERLASIHQSIVRNAAPIARMNPIEAEITKIASNTHETMRVSFANMLCSLCNEIPGCDVDRITGALTHRMGKRFFRGAVPYGGPCWPRDNAALAAFMDVVGVSSAIPRTVDLFNGDHARYVLRKMLEVTRPGETVGILGLAYKPGTSVVQQAFGTNLASCLATEGRNVVVWDPLAVEPARAVLADKVFFASSADDCIRRSQVAIIVNPLAELQHVDWSSVGNRTVVDCWRCLKPEHAGMLRDYRPLGRNSDFNEKTLLSKIGPERLRLLME